MINPEIPKCYRIIRRRQKKSRRQKLATNRMRQVLTKCNYDLEGAKLMIDKIVAKKQADIEKQVLVDADIKKELPRIKRSIIKSGYDLLPAGSCQPGARLNYQLIQALNDQGIHFYLLKRKGKKKLYIEQKSRSEFIKAQVNIYKTSLQLQAIELDNIKQGRADINSTNMRLDTPITNCHSALLNYVTLDGEPLKELDLSNSQFVIYATIVDHSLRWIVDNWKMIQKALTSKNQRRIDRIFQKALKNRKFSRRNTRERHLDKHIKQYRARIWKYIKEHKDTFVSLNSYTKLTINDLYELLPDLQQFKTLATSGQLYEFIAEKLSISRNEAKGAMFRIFFDRPYCYDFEVKDRIRALLPHSISIVDYYKRDYGGHLAQSHGEGRIARLGGKTARKWASDSFAIMLQRVESEIFISGLFNALYKQGFRVLTKHDSLLCAASDYQSVCAASFVYLDQIFNIGYRMATEGQSVSRMTPVPQQLKLNLKTASNKGWEKLNHIADMIRDHFGYLCSPQDLAQLRILGKEHTVRGLYVKMQRVLLLMKVRDQRFESSVLYGFEGWLRKG